MIIIIYLAFASRKYQSPLIAGGNQDSHAANSGVQCA